MKIIYGTDNRRDIGYLQAVIHHAKSVGIIVHKHALVKLNKSYSALVTLPFHEYVKATHQYPLCQEEVFYDQIRPVTSNNCTGFLVHEQIMATAYHCVYPSDNHDTLPDKPWEDLRVIFDFHAGNKGAISTLIHNDTQVYSFKSVIAGEGQESPAEPDWILLKLDRPVHDRPPLPMSNQKPAYKTKLYIIGHPISLPLKYADDATSIDYSRTNNPIYRRHCFMAKLDSYGGNSGSPVFNAKTHKVEGILTGGKEDFVIDNSCMLSRTVLNAHSIEYENVQRIQPAKRALTNYLNQNS
ncbi:MAG: trypsin-like serine peptidase [Flammeovirgaceae bacterium]